jgi:hypothetical protein
MKNLIIKKAEAAFTASHFALERAKGVI